MRKIAVIIHFAIFAFVCFSFSSLANDKEKGPQISICLPASAHIRLQFGAEKLVKALEQSGYTAVVIKQDKLPVQKDLIAMGSWDDELISSATSGAAKPGKEGFIIKSLQNNTTIVAGSDYSGALYGCIELADRIISAGKLPQHLTVTDQPEMVLRGACIGVQKPYYLPGRNVYEYPYTPETFPWLYDKALWIKFLDSMVENRMNSLYLWNGHPFASLVRLKDYPYAVEVDDATFKKNEEIFGFLTHEADKRGIWVIQMFYNIIVSKPFAQHHNIKAQDRNRPIIPLIADYTRKSIAAFVEKYPNVGLLCCLGEAMEGVGNDDIEWFTKTIIPGVKDGLKALGKTEEPPIVLRAHDTDAPSVMKAALPLYKNLYTEAKFNGEALTTSEPRGKWAELHRTLAGLGSIQIENVHIMANLEPFRYGSPDFIQKSVKGMLNIMHGRGLHLFPQASYWDWPYSADSVKGDRLLQIDRDWIWYSAWSRYAWKSTRNRQDEIGYWSQKLAQQFGCSAAQGKNILEAYEQSGEIAPKLLRRFGITDGNRQTLTLGMQMTQLINPFRFGLFTLLYDSESPEGEMLIQYAEKEWRKEKHIGETPPQIIAEVRQHGTKAVAAIDAAEKTVTRNKAEFERLKNDMYCYKALADHFALKAEAALHILRYKYSNDVKDLEKGFIYLDQSVTTFKKLVKFTEGHYLYANSMQTQQRKIPIGGNNGRNKTWAELLPLYERELSHFRHSIDSLKSPSKNTTANTKATLKNADVTITSSYEGNYSITVGQQMFSDTMAVIRDYAPELITLKGMRFNKAKQIQEGTTVNFTNTQPVKVLVGFFNKKGDQLLPEPELEIDASANDYGQSETKIANAITVTGFPPVNVHTYSFKPGNNTLKLAKGACMVLGFVNEDALTKAYDAGRVPGVTKLELDWLFE